MLIRVKTEVKRFSELNHNMKEASKAFKTRKKFKYFEKTLTYQNYIHKGIRSILNLMNAFYLRGKNFLSPLLLYKNLKIRNKKSKAA
jgi:hypothetical protein